jgi:hypothetical protein
MGEKYFSDLEGFKECFIEVSDNWTVKEMRQLSESDTEEAYFEIFKSKVESMYLRDVSGVEFTNPKEFKGDDIEDFDVAMAGFIGGILPLHVRKRRNLGGLAVRPSSTGSGGVDSQKKNGKS